MNNKRKLGILLTAPFFIVGIYYLLYIFLQAPIQIIGAAIVIIMFWKGIKLILEN